MTSRLSPQPTTSRTRDLEWVAASFFLGMSVALAYPGNTLDSPSYALFHIGGLGESFWTWAFAGIGIGRMTVLYINGRSPRTPFLRILGAFVGLVAWSQIGIMLAIASKQAYGAINIGAGLFAPLVIFECISIVRASVDARYVRRR